MYTLVVTICLALPVPEGTRIQCRAERIDNLSSTVCVDLRNMADARRTKNVAVHAQCTKTGVIGTSPEINS